MNNENEIIVENEVNEFIKIGYIPQGGIAFIPETDHTRMWYAQAMILMDEK